MARRKTLPQVSPKVATELRPLVTAIKEIIETGEGVRGDPLDRKLTLRDLVDSGIGKLRAGATASNPNALQPNPAPPNLATPPQPTGFNAAGAFDGQIFLTWDIPGTLYSNHAYTNVYRAEEDNFANAILVGREAGSFYTDDVRSDVTIKPYYYWISFTSASDIEGPLNATAGTMAQALNDPDYIIEQINGRVSESELANELLTPIQSIPSIQTTLDDYGTRIPSLETTVGNHAIQIPNLQTTVDDLNTRVPLIEGDVLASQQDITALQTDVSVAEQDIVANTSALNTLTTRVTTNEGAISAQSTDITNLETSLSNTNANVTANATATSQLDTRVTTAENTISAHSGEITSLQTTLNDLTIASFDPSVAYSIGELFRYDNVVYEVIATQSQPNTTPPNATYYVPRPDYETIADTVSANSAAVSSLDTRVTSAEGSITSQATDITGLQADLNLAEGDISANSTAITQIDTRVTTAEGTISTQSSDITQLQNDLTLTQGDVTANANATTSLATRVTAAEGDITSVSGDITTLQNSLSTTNGNVTTNANAITSLQTEVSNIDGVITSQSTDITQLQNDLDAAELDVTANADAITSLDTRVTATEGDISSQSTQLTNLGNSLTTAEGDITANSQALTLLDSRVTTAEGTISTHTSQITQLQTDVSNLDVDGNAAALQALDVRVTANEQDITAIASDITNLEASVNGNTSAIQTKAEVSAVQAVEDNVTTLSAEYTVKLDVDGRVSGIGLASDGNASEFIVASDAVYFIDPGQSIAPFDPNANYASMAAVRDTQLVFGYAEVEGFKRFVINVPAYIPEGYIESGMVGAISFGKITTDTGVPVTTVDGLLKADYIDVDNLSVASAATFYGDAQSGNFATDTAGWKLWQTGDLEAYNVTIRGHIEADSGYIASTLQIGGTSQDIGEVAQLANDAGNTAITVDNWKKPGTTFIAGASIFADDVYVDTVNIKGNAVIVPASVSGSGSAGENYWGSNFASIAYSHGENEPIPIIVTAFVDGRAGVLVGSSGVQRSWRFRLVVSGSVRYTSPWLKGPSDNIQGYVSGGCCIRYNLGSGSHSIYVNAQSEENTDWAYMSATITIIGCKR